MDRQRRRITDAAAAALRVIRNDTTRMTWTAGEAVAYHSRRGTPQYGMIISNRNIRKLRQVRLTAQGEPLETTRRVTIPAQAYDERGMEVAGPPIWKVRLSSAGMVEGLSLIHI